MINISPIVLELLRLRGIEKEEDVAEFLSPSPRLTYEPMLMKGMKEGVELVLEYARSGRKICIYGDYDADGITSVAIMMEALSLITSELDYYIPSRFDEGYGLNADAIDNIAEAGAELILTVDCGSVSRAEVEHAREKGLEVVVTDHHNIDDVKAECILINPKQDGCSYPFKGLAGCGVAFKFVCALQKAAGLDRRILIDVLDLVAIGTVGDIVPLVDENRTLVKFGLKALRTSQRKGLRALISAMGIDQAAITEEHLAYNVVPHLNAAGRMKDAARAVRVILSDDDEEIRRGVADILQLNQERKRFQEEAYLKCVDVVDTHLKDRQFIVLRCEDVHEGITGIVAGKLKDKYERPVIILTPAGEGFLKGTGRSIPGINLYDVMKQEQERFEKFGGHAGACGFTMKEEYFSSVAENLDRTVAAMMDENPELAEAGETTDMELRVSDVTIENYEDIQLISPFGQSNEKPVFSVSAEIYDIFYMGNERQHVKFNACDRQGNRFKCVLFGRAAEYRKLLSEGAEVVLAGTLDKSIWKEKTTIQLKVSSIRMK